jgi:DNA polymerase V
MLTIESIAPCVEQYSIDEAFVPLSGPLAANADELAHMLRQRIRQWTGIPALAQGNSVQFRTAPVIGLKKERGALRRPWPRSLGRPPCNCSRKTST